MLGTTNKKNRNVPCNILVGPFSLQTVVWRLHVLGAACCLRLILVHPSQRHGLVTSKTVYCVCLPKYYNNISLKLDMFSNKKGYAYWSDTMKTGD